MLRREAPSSEAAPTARDVRHFSYFSCFSWQSLDPATQNAATVFSVWSVDSLFYCPGRKEKVKPTTDSWDCMPVSRMLLR